MPKRKLKPKSSHRVFGREFEISIVCRMLAGESVSALSRERKMTRKDLYAWRDRFQLGKGAFQKHELNNQIAAPKSPTICGICNSKSTAATVTIRSYRWRISGSESGLTRPQLSARYESVGGCGRSREAAGGSGRGRR
jgi:transposase-like protein